FSLNYSKNFALIGHLHNFGGDQHQLLYNYIEIEDSHILLQGLNIDAYCEINGKINDEFH
ncbi:11998_t:CDS:1, partial [Funneliformis caledonium]